MKGQLQRLHELLGELRRTTSIKAKVDVLRAYGDLKGVLMGVYSDRSFGIRSSSLPKNVNMESMIEKPKTLDEFVKSLNEGEYSRSDRTMDKLNAIIFAHKEYTTILHSIIDKDLKARIGSGILRQAFAHDDPCSLPVSLGEQLPLDELISHLQISKYSWLVSRKIDGVRCLIRIAPDRTVSFLSRQSRPMNGSIEGALRPRLDPFVRLPQELDGETVYLDGELAVVDRNADDFKESFQETVSLVLSKSSGRSIDRLMFYCFDCLTESEMFGKADTMLSKRLERLNGLAFPYPPNRVIPLQQFTLSGDMATSVNSLITDYIEPLGWEGAIIRKDAPFKGGRSKDLLKLKVFLDAEFPVVGILTGPMRILTDGWERTETVLSAIVIHVERDGRTGRVSVGSGFSISERRRFAERPEEIVGKVVTVKYFEESAGEDGEPSLRFPVFKGIREDLPSTSCKPVDIVVMSKKR